MVKGIDSFPAYQAAQGETVKQQARQVPERVREEPRAKAPTPQRANIAAKVTAANTEQKPRPAANAKGAQTPLDNVRARSKERAQAAKIIEKLKKAEPVANLEKPKRVLPPEPKPRPAPAEGRGKIVDLDA